MRFSESHGRLTAEKHRLAHTPSLYVNRVEVIGDGTKNTLLANEITRKPAESECPMFSNWNSGFLHLTRRTTTAEVRKTHVMLSVHDLLVVVPKGTKWMTFWTIMYWIGTMDGWHLMQKNKKYFLDDWNVTCSVILDWYSHEGCLNLSFGRRRAILFRSVAASEGAFWCRRERCSLKVPYQMSSVDFYLRNHLEEGPGYSSIVEKARADGRLTNRIRMA